MGIFRKLNSITKSDYDYTVITQNTSPRIKITRFTNVVILPIIEFKADSPYNTILSYTYSRSIDDINGKFSLRIKDVVLANGKTLFDTIQNLDIVSIYRDTYSNNKSADFVGIVHSKQVSASISSDGKVRKEISISGKSILSLFNDFNINLSTIGTYATSTDAANFLVKNNYFKVDNSSGVFKLEPQGMQQIVTSIWNDFKTYAQKLSGVTNTDILQIITQSNIEIECQNIDCKYPISTNLYTNGEITFISMLNNLFPSGVYEIFEQNRKLVVREVPFRKLDWMKLDKEHCYIIDVSRLLEYDFSMSDNEVYSVFMADVEGLKDIDTSYNHNKREANNNGFINVEKNDENLKKYGYRICNVSYLGYVQNPSVSTSVDTKENLFKSLNLDLKEMYENVHKMLSGRIKVVDSKESPTIGEKINFRLNNTVTSFYINSESHSWSYGSTPTVDYSISRGAIYENGSFNRTPDKFGTDLEIQIKKG